MGRCSYSYINCNNNNKVQKDIIKILKLKKPTLLREF